MITFAFDPGVRCGVAVFDGAEPVLADTRDFTPPKKGMRWGRQAHAIHDALEALAECFGDPDLIVHEKLRDGMHMSHAACGSYQRIITAIERWASIRKTEVIGIAPPTVKVFAVKNGATKDQMIDAARTRWPRLTIPDDNAADALWIGACGIEQKLWK